MKIALGIIGAIIVIALMAGFVYGLTREPAANHRAELQIHLA